METRDRPVRVGVYGTGSWANRTHIPNLLKLDGVEIVAVCDVNTETLAATAEKFAIPRTYQDGHDMLAQEELDALYSVVPAFARTDVEAAAAAKGIHLFSEKPQSTTMAVARRIDAAVQQSGVLSTVCFRERYRPIFQEARRLLEDKKVAHIRFQSTGGLPETQVPPGQEDNWNYQMDKAGGSAFDWGVHAVDYSRFMSGLNVTRAQAFYHHPEPYNKPLSCSFNFCLTNGATMTMSFLSSTPVSPEEPYFLIYFEGGYLAIHRYDHIEVNGEKVYQAEQFDPWFEQDRIFIEAVRSGDGGAILNDYHDGLSSLAPVLAGWESARRGGDCLDVAAFMDA
jgi:predicted dehydrogenase